MIAGNIPGRTQTTPTAIYLAVDAGNTTMAWLWTLSMIAVSFTAVFCQIEKRLASSACGELVVFFVRFMNDPGRKAERKRPGDTNHSAALPIDGTLNNKFDQVGI